ncbi:hypothetical protein FACS1894189_0320 [Planctomycetales bacterium]|nr:hypothetical protein FACS1894189_0320 [Planctomycetales bacterium]
MNRLLGSRDKLVVALLGGTGTGKSSLLNALIGENIVKTGRERPTTNEPVLVCHTDADTSRFEGMTIERRNNPSLEQMMILDCPDPDTTETSLARQGDDLARLTRSREEESNLAKLRKVLPFCDILLVTATQQKYRSSKVLDELSAAAPGARLVFVQTHADRDTDIRDDWKELLSKDYEPGEVYFVDSLHPNADLESLRSLLTHDLNEEAAFRIRQANYFGLAKETIADCKRFIEEEWLPVKKLRERISEERRRFGERMAEKMQGELVRDRRTWEAKLIGRVSAQWGYSPFSLLLRIYQGLGGILSGAILTRARSPVQLAIWGAFEGARRLKKSRSKKPRTVQPISPDDENTLKESSLVLTGFAADAHLPAACCSPELVLTEAKQAGESLIADIGAELEAILGNLAERHNHLWQRILYETLLGGMLLFLLYRPAKNFFIDSFFYNVTPFGLDQYIISLFWLIIWSAILLGCFTWMLRSGIDRSIRDASADWDRLPSQNQLFSALEQETTQVLTFRDELENINQRIARLDQQGEKLDKRLGRKR